MFFDIRKQPYIFAGSSVLLQVVRLLRATEEVTSLSFLYINDYLLKANMLVKKTLQIKCVLEMFIVIRTTTDHYLFFLNDSVFYQLSNIGVSPVLHIHVYEFFFYSRLQEIENVHGQGQLSKRWIPVPSINRHMNKEERIKTVRHQPSFNIVLRLQSFCITAS